MAAILRRWLPIALAAAALTALTGHRICDWIFDCGCTWILAGGDAHCDVHTAGPPDCPVCADLGVGATSALALFGGWSALLAGAARFVRRARASPS